MDTPTKIARGLDSKIAQSLDIIDSAIRDNPASHVFGVIILPIPRSGVLSE